MISRRGFFAVLAGVLAAPKALFGKKPVAPKRLLDEIWQAANEMRDKAGPGYSVNVWVTQQALDQIREETGASEWHPVKAKRDPKFFVQEHRDMVGAFGDHRVMLAQVHPSGRQWWIELVRSERPVFVGREAGRIAFGLTPDQCDEINRRSAEECRRLGIRMLKE